MKTAIHRSTDTAIALPTSALLWTVGGVAALVGASWTIAAAAGGWPADVQSAGLAGGAVVGAVSVAGVIIMKPWKSRPMIDWMTMWLAATVFRMFLTPAATFLLYFAAPLNAFALTLSVGSAYLIVLLAEAIVLTRYVQKSEVRGQRSEARSRGSAVPSNVSLDT